jgi:hypothetical protein
MPVGILIEACAGCARRWGQSAGFRRDNRQRVTTAAIAGFQRRVADLLGVSDPLQVFASSTPAHAEIALGLQPGAIHGAMRAALGRVQ